MEHDGGTQECLNPYSTGSNSNRKGKGLCSRLGQNVLILILLEVTQINQNMSAVFAAIMRLNPYSTGSNSNINPKQSPCSIVSVLILILLEVTQIHMQWRSRVPKQCVLILILLEVTQIISSAALVRQTLS